jgi:hypothetical protein
VLIRKGDLVRVNKWCSAGGLIGRVGIVKGFKSIGNADCVRIHIDTGWTPLVRLNAVDVISSIREER